MPSTLLERLTSPDSLHAAWRRTRSGGKTPGLDGVTIPWFERHAERELKRLAAELRAGTYRPWPARRFVVAKESGGVREIGVQAVRDRVAQRALLEILQPRVEARLEEAAWAFRPGRSIEGALSRLEGWRAAGLNWVARADIAVCFDSIPIERLEAALPAILPERAGRELVARWLRAGAVDSGGFDTRQEGGLPQGDVLSPLLCNFYLDPLDEAVLSAHPMIRYADDFAIVGESESVVRKGLARAETALEALGLTLNRKKESVGTFSQGFTFLGAAICGALRLPLRPLGPGRWGYGYDAPRPERKAPALAPDEDALTRRFVGLLRRERSGRPLTVMEQALLRAWAHRPAVERLADGWQSVYLL